MSIRSVPTNGPQVGAGAAGGLPPTLDKGLKDAGLVNQGATPQASKDAAQNLLQNLAKAGFQAPAGSPKGDLANQISTALKQFQQVSSLQKTGQLDAATQSALKNAGIIGQPQEAQQKDAAARDNFEKGGAGLLKQGEKSRSDLVNAGTPDTNFLDALINQLGPGGPNEGTSASDVKGAAQAQEAKVDSQKVSETKKGEGAQKKGSTTDAQKDMPELPTNQQLDKGTSMGVKVMRGLKSENTKTEEKRRRDNIGTKDPTELGILDEEADEDAVEGNGEDGKKKRGQGGDGDGGQAEGEERAGSEGERDEDGSERDRGNASSGDENFNDKKRGNASTDDGSGDGAGHYRVASMSEQAFASLDKIVRDPAAENRATTYSWDVTFYKPGVYGSGQKAQELVHLVVTNATAFDPVWSKAQANLNVLVKRLDQDGAVPTLDDIIGAIRQARARDGDTTASKLHKFHRPLGKA